LSLAVVAVVDLAVVVVLVDLEQTWLVRHLAAEQVLSLCLLLGHLLITPLPLVLEVLLEQPIQML
jgi:hypothetical protein